MRSDWSCTLEKEGEQFVLRVGLRYVRGLRQAAAGQLVASRNEHSFVSISDLTKRVPELSKSDLHMMATVGALKVIGTETGIKLHRRDALWQVQNYGSRVPRMFEEITEHDETSPLTPMTIDERLVADYHGTGLTIGPHPMAYRREELRRIRFRRTSLHLRDSIVLLRARS
jgi:error-prone DNA polymerase